MNILVVFRLCFSYRENNYIIFNEKLTYNNTTIKYKQIKEQPMFHACLALINILSFLFLIIPFLIIPSFEFFLFILGKLAGCGL